MYHKEEGGSPETFFSFHLLTFDVLLRNVNNMVKGIFVTQCTQLPVVSIKCFEWSSLNEEVQRWECITAFYSVLQELIHLVFAAIHNQ